MDLMTLLAQVLNPNPGAQANRLTHSPQMESANYLTQTSAPMGGMPAMAPAAPAQAFQAPQAPTQPAMPQSAPAASGGGIGGFLSGLLGGGRDAGRNETVQWLMGQGMDEGTATMYASNKPALQQFLLQRSQGADPMKALQAEKLGLEIDQMRKPAARPTTTINDKLVYTDTGEVVGDYGGGTDTARPITPEERAQWGIPEGDTRPYTITPGQAPQPLQGSTTREQGADFKNEMDTRKEYDADPVIKDYKVVRSNYERVRTGVELGTGAGDIAIIFGFMKMLDPTSVVRENEQATAENAGGIPATIRNLYNKALEGDRLPPQSRTEILAAADKVYGEVVGNVEETNKRYGDIATNWQLDPSRILMQPERYDPIASPMQPPPAGGLPLPPPQGAPAPAPPAPVAPAPVSPSPQGGVTDWKDWIRAPKGPGYKGAK